MLQSNEHLHANDTQQPAASLCATVVGPSQQSGGCLCFTVHLSLGFVSVCLSGHQLLYFLLFLSLSHTPRLCLAIAQPTPQKPPPALPFPPSAAIVFSLPSTGPLIWLGWHVPRLYLTLVQINSWTNLWWNLPQTSLPLSSSSISAPLLFLPPCSLPFLQLESYLLPPVCRNESLRRSPLCSFSTCLLFSGRLSSTPPSFPTYTHPSPLNLTCSHCCVAPIYGFITAASQGKRKGEKW